MINNLEHIKLNEVLSNDGIPYLKFRRNLKPNYFIVWRDILIGYILLMVLFGISIYNGKNFELSIGNVLIQIGLAFLIAFVIAYIQLFVHEASHHNIHPDKVINDKLANAFLCIFTGMEMDSYRKTHWKHHLRLGHTDDTEHSYFDALTFPFLLKMLTGVHALNIILSRNKLENAQTKESNKKQKIGLIRGLVFHLVLLTALFYFGNYATVLTWVIAIGVFYPFFASLRQLMEHRDEKISSSVDCTKQEHGKLSRLFAPGPFSFFFGGAGFNRHLIHHWDPQVSYTNLKELESYLENTEACSEIIKKSRTTYFKTFIKLINHGV